MNLMAKETIIAFFILVCKGIRAEYENGASHRDFERDMKTLKNLLEKI